MQQDVETLYGTISEFVGACRAALREGTFFDMKGFDESIADLCRAVEALPREQGIPFASRLTALLQEVEVLEAELKAERDNVMRELQGTDAVSRANKAYARMDTIDGTGKKLPGE